MKTLLFIMTLVSTNLVFASEMTIKEAKEIVNTEGLSTEGLNVVQILEKAVEILNAQKAQKDEEAKQLFIKNCSRSKVDLLDAKIDFLKAKEAVSSYDRDISSQIIALNRQRLNCWKVPRYNNNECVNMRTDDNKKTGVEHRGITENLGSNAHAAINTQLTRLSAQRDKYDDKTDERSKYLDGIACNMRPMQLSIQLRLWDNHYSEDPCTFSTKYPSSFEWMMFESPDFKAYINAASCK